MTAFEPSSACCKEKNQGQRRLEYEEPTTHEGIVRLNEKNIAFQ
jgi:hypothetical protein